MKPKFCDFSRNSKKITFLIITLCVIYIAPRCFAASTDLPADLQNRVFLIMKAEKTRAYQDERILLTITLYTDGLTVRDVRYPNFSHEGFSAGGFGNPIESYETIDRVTYNTMEFRTYVIPKKTGDLKLGPAVLQCSVLLQSSDNPADAFFGGHKIHTLNLKSEEIPIRILPFPQKGKPSDFEGAVGNFNLTIEVQPKEVKVGDPVSVKIMIKGNGNLDTVTCPEIEAKDGFRMYEPSVIQKDSAKICEQVLLPTTDTIREIPAVHFSFFDPDRETYLTLKREPTPIKVSKPYGEEDSKITGIARPDSIKKYPGKLIRKGEVLYKNPVFLTFNIFLLMLFISLLIVRKRKEKIKGYYRKYAQRLNTSRELKRGMRAAERALHEGDSAEFYTIIFRTLQDYLGYKFHIPPGGITVGIIYNVLRPRGVNEEVLKNIKDIFEDCDMARYASIESGRTEMEETFDMLKEVIRYLNRE